MNWEAISAIAEILGVLAVVISLIYVGFQVRQNTMQLRQDNLLKNVRGTLDTNWYYHRDPTAFDVFRRGVKSFHELPPKDQAHFHSVLVDLAFYLQMVWDLAQHGLVDRSAVEVNEGSGLTTRVIRSRCPSLRSTTSRRSWKRTRAGGARSLSCSGGSLPSRLDHGASGALVSV
jgi:hypothetical protein